MLPLKKSLIRLDEYAEKPEDAIRIAGELIVENGGATKEYVEAMINAYHDLGPYIVLAPHIAIPHARPEDGVLEQCISVLRLEEPIAFGHPENDKVKLIIAIGGVDKDFHIQMLQTLSTVLSDSENINILMNSDDKDEIYSTLIN